MKKVPFIIPELDLGVRIQRLMVIIHKLGLNKNKKAVLDNEKIAIFDFLVKNPYILNEVLKTEGKANTIDIGETDYGTIDSLYPSVISLLDYGSIKGYLQILVTLDFIEIQVNETIFYISTTKGERLITEDESPYLLRIEQLSLAVLPLRNFSTLQLIKKIRPFIKGV
ncbi:ABC-three component system middle component 4 [Paenibacillus sp. sgz500992]|uniref:ABC-three component system middle component 4 n=1 Tax=Paenibacillus sp. sgz500992 TaxID=3242476 RepID=UPI0036D31508